MLIDLAAPEYVRQLRHAELRPSEKLVQKILATGDGAIGPLLELATDSELIYEQPPLCYAPLHALRLLGELGSTKIIEPLLLAYPVDNGYTEEHSPPEAWDNELPQILGRLGEVAVEPLWAYVDDQEKSVESRGAALSALAYATALTPELRDTVVAGLRERLGQSEDKTFTGHVLAALANIGVAEVYPEALALYRAGRVDQELIPPGAARQLLLSDGSKRLACVKHPLWERYDQHGPFAGRR